MRYLFLYYKISFHKSTVGENIIGTPRTPNNYDQIVLLKTFLLLLVFIPKGNVW